MGIGFHIVEPLIREAAFRPITGDVLTIGRQTVYYTPEQILQTMQHHGLDTSGVEPQSIELDTSTLDPLPEYKGAKLISDKALFRLITKGTLHAMDRSDYEGADVIHDLTLPLPPSLHGTVDFVIDGSTLDNTFNPVQTLKNYCDLLRPGGRLLMHNAFSGEGTPYCIMPPMWYLDYFVMNGFVDAKIYIFVYRLQNPAPHNVFTLDLDYLQQHRRRMGRFVCWHPAVIVAFAEKGPASTTNVFPVQQDYRSEEDWEIYCQNLAVMQRSTRPHLLGSNSEAFIAGLTAGHKFIDWSHRALDVPDRLIPSEATDVATLPWLPPPGHWLGVCGLHIEAIAGPASPAGQVPLRLVASAGADRHFVAATFGGSSSAGIYRVAVWIKTGPVPANVQLQVRDSIDPRTGKAHEGEARFDLSSSVPLVCNGNVLAHGIEQVADGWRKLWLDTTTADGKIFVSLGMLEAASNIHLFKSAGQELILGGIEIVPATLGQIRGPLKRLVGGVLRALTASTQRDR